MTTGLISNGQQVTWRATHFGVRQSFTSQITAFDAPNSFQDTMLAGAFRSFQHDHCFQALSAESTVMRDELRFEAPLGLLGRLAEQFILKQYLRQFLQERNTVIKRIAETDEWQRYLPQDFS